MKTLMHLSPHFTVLVAHLVMVASQRPIFESPIPAGADVLAVGAVPGSVGPAGFRCSHAQGLVHRL
eukprot:301115-Hanusia_phi.AAC.2